MICKVNTCQVVALRSSNSDSSRIYSQFIVIIPYFICSCAATFLRTDCNRDSINSCSDWLINLVRKSCQVKVWEQCSIVIIEVEHCRAGLCLAINNKAALVGGNINNEVAINSHLEVVTIVKSDCCAQVGLSDSIATTIPGAPLIYKLELVIDRQFLLNGPAIASSFQCIGLAPVIESTSKEQLCFLANCELLVGAYSECAVATNLHIEVRAINKLNVGANVFCNTEVVTSRATKPRNIAAINLENLESHAVGQGLVVKNVTAIGTSCELIVLILLSPPVERANQIVVGTCNL